MEIKKGNIKLREQVSKNLTNVLVEGDIVISDTMPDMAEILAADAKVSVHTDECIKGALTVKGDVVFNVLYKADATGEIKSCEQTFPFVRTVELKCTEDAECMAYAEVEHIGFTLVNSRKLSAKVMVALTTRAVQNKEYEPITEICGDDAESRNKKYSIYIPISENCTEIEVSDILTIPNDKPDIGEILKTDAYVIPNDVKIMTGKVMVHGELRINTLYSASDNDELTSVCHSVPFTDVIDAVGADDQSVVNVSYKLEQIYATGKGDLKGDTKIISIDARINVTAKVSRTVSEKIVDDCYMLHSGEDVTRANMKICEYITSENARVQAQGRIEAPKNVKIKEVIDCCVKPLLRECTWENGTAQVKGTLAGTVIYRDDEGNYRSATCENDILWQKPIAENCDIEAELWTDSVNYEADDNGVQLFCNLGIFAKALKSHNVEIITDMHIKNDENEPKQPGMVVYFAKDGDTLWSVAKKYRTKSDRIKKANNMENDKIETGRRLLIPKA